MSTQKNAFSTAQARAGPTGRAGTAPPGPPSARRSDRADGPGRGAVGSFGDALHTPQPTTRRRRGRRRTRGSRGRGGAARCTAQPPGKGSGPGGRRASAAMRSTGPARPSRRTGDGRTPRNGSTRRTPGTRGAFRPRRRRPPRGPPRGRKGTRHLGGSVRRPRPDRPRGRQLSHRRVARRLASMSSKGISSPRLMPLHRRPASAHMSAFTRFVGQKGQVRHCTGRTG